MGLFDNPEYFAANVEALKNVEATEPGLITYESTTKVVQNSSLIKTASSISINETQKVSISRNFNENFVLAPLLPEDHKSPLSITTLQPTAKNGSLIIKILLTLCFGSMINQCLIYSFAFTLINFVSNQKKPEYAIPHCALGIIVPIGFVVMVYFIWRPTSKSIFIISSILLAQLILFSLYPYLSHGSLKDGNCKSECQKDYFAALIIFLVHLLSIILAYCQFYLIK
jgi:hypothetical protein